MFLLSPVVFWHCPLITLCLQSLCNSFWYFSHAKNNYDWQLKMTYHNQKNYSAEVFIKKTTSVFCLQCTNFYIICFETDENVYWIPFDEVANPCKNNSFLGIYLLVLFCLLFAIFQQASDLVATTGFLSTTQYSSKSLHSPIRPWQPVSHLISTISCNYTSHHEISVLQPSNYSKYHICLLVLVVTPSATALLQHGTPFLPPSKTVRP